MGRRKKHPPEDLESCAMVCTLRLIDKKWALLVIAELLEHEEGLTFSEIQRKILERTGEKISPSVLSSTLVHLENNSVVHRRVLAEQRPIRVNYTLTDLGNKLIYVLALLKSWGLHWGQKTNKFCKAGECKHKQIPLIPIEKIQHLFDEFNSTHEHES